MCVNVFLQAIETFAVTVKEIAQLLQGFGSELSETELPDEANAIEFLLHSHTHRYRQMKVVSSLFSHPSSHLSSSLSISVSDTFYISHLAVFQLLKVFFCVSGRYTKRAERRSAAAVQPGDRQGLEERRRGGEGPQIRHGHRSEVQHQWISQAQRDINWTQVVIKQ